MKYFTLLLLVLSFTGHSQKASYIDNSTDQSGFEEKLLSKKDFKKANGRMLVSNFGCSVSDDAATSKFLVSVVCQEKVFSEIGVDKINEMIVTANGKVRTSLAEQLKYKPSEIKMAYNPQSKDWSLTNLFTTVDEFGLVQTELLALDFDSEGRFLAMKRVF